VKPSSKLAGYLSDIQSGKLINFPVFCKELKKKQISEITIREVFAAGLVKTNRYRITVLDQKVFDEICQRFQMAELDSRVSAALSGNSHRASVSGSYLLMRTISEPHPVVVWFDTEKFVCPVKTANTVLLVENLENFIELQATLDLLVSWGFDIKYDELDVVFGAGNQVTNQLHMPFLSRYRRVYCLFDLDPGGIRMFCSLLNQLAQELLCFILPVDLELRLKKSEWHLSAEERTELLRYTGQSLEIDTLINQLRVTQRKLEQETYLSR
jgi:hypothetical protein